MEGSTVNYRCRIDDSYQLSMTIMKVLHYFLSSMFSAVGYNGSPSLELSELRFGKIWRDLVRFSTFPEIGRDSVDLVRYGEIR